MTAREAVVIGAGPNGLVAAAHLARAGLSPLVLERRELVGGSAVTEEFHPGFRASMVAASPAPLLPEVVRGLGLERHGFAAVRPPIRLTALSADGRALSLGDDPVETAASIAEFSASDAKRYAAFRESLERIGGALSPLLTTTPPPIDGASMGDLWPLFRIGRRIRGLGRRDEYRLLRWLPMAVADLAGEWFESEPLRAAVAARGIAAMFAGPWSAGTSANLLVAAAADPHPAGPACVVRGGMGALSEALAASARAAGAEIRTGVEVERVLVERGAAAGVLVAGGQEIRARRVVSSADPRRTLLSLVAPADLDPEFLAKIQSYRSNGAAAKIHFALSGLPRFTALESGGDGARALAGRIQIGAGVDELERAFDAAKYGDFSPRPWCELVIPTVSDPSPAQPGAHVLSAHVQFAPYKLARDDWESRRDALAEAVVRRIEEHAPGFARLILGRRVLAPPDLEATYALTGGHLHHGEHALDQLFAMRPLLGWARYRTPIEGLYLCGAGTHPGGGVTGACGFNAAREIIRDARRRGR